MTTSSPASHPNIQMEALEAQLAEFRDGFARSRQQLHQVIVGQESIVDYVLMAVYLQGHVLLEGVPGLGKTLLMSALADAFGMEASRVQFTPDLMPADIVGTRVLQQDEKGRVHFEFEKGPVFTNILLADEINRATPKTQSALLQAMQERHVTVAGLTYRLPEPFLVMATQNPLESEGTYPLPEAQLDRFLFKLIVRFPTQLELVEIVKRTTQGQTPKVPKSANMSAKIIELGGLLLRVPMAIPVMDYAARMLLATHPAEGHPTHQSIGRYVRCGASPRGLQALVLASKLHAVLDGRFAVSREDVAQVAKPCLRHRLLLTFEAEAEGITCDNLVDRVIKALA